MKKILIQFAVLLFSFNSLFAATKKNIPDYQAAYRTAICYFDEGDYGRALKFAEDAITYKKELAEYESETLNNTLAVRQIRKANNKINLIIPILQEREEKEPVRIINKYLSKKDEDFFKNDITNLIEYIQNNYEYPEALKLIGDIYKLEGEYVFAENYYKRALSNEAVLDIPDSRYEILYQLADISKLSEDKEQYELRLLNILTQDNNFLNDVLVESMCSTVSKNTKDSVEKFLQLYRSDSYYSLKAYNSLIEYYFEEKELDKALKFSCLSVITGFTKVYNTLEKRDINFTYTNLGDFFQETVNFNDINKWAKENDVWKSFNKLAEITTRLGYKNFSESLLKTIIQFSPDEYWQKNAVLQLSYLNVD